MSVRVMIFIDGSWLYHILPKMQDEFEDQNYRIDYGKLPLLIQHDLSEQLNINDNDIDIIRTEIFGSIPTEYNDEDSEIVKKQQIFYDDLKELFRYDTSIHNLRFFNPEDPKNPHRIRPKDRLLNNDSWVPKEKCVDIDLAASMVYYAAVPYAYDIAVLVAGDRDYAPLLKRVRELGKRVMVVGWRGSSASIYLDPKDPEKILDFVTLLLNTQLAELQLKFEKYHATCASCSKKFWTNFQPRKGHKIYCDDCKEKYRKKKDGFP